MNDRKHAPYLIKATTPEGMNAEGRLECMSARCVCMLSQGCTGNEQMAP